MSRGFSNIAGIDEVGRGALAGPVVAAAVVLPPVKSLKKLKEIKDSKLVSPGKRSVLFNVIEEEALSVGIGIVDSKTIDLINIFNATKQAMRYAIERLAFVPDYLLVDGFPISKVNIPQKGIIKGDRTCLSIACASIIAKVTRDKIMIELDRVYQGYQFNKHKGYGTSVHLSKLNNLGPSPVHRFSFAPVRQTMRLI